MAQKEKAGSAAPRRLRLSGDEADQLREELLNARRALGSLTGALRRETAIPGKALRHASTVDRSLVNAQRIAKPREGK